MPLKARDLPRLGDEVDVELVPVVHEQTLQVDDERLEGRLGRRYERHQLDGVTLLRGGASDADHLAARLGDEDDLVFLVDIAGIPAAIAGEEGIHPLVVYADEIPAHLVENELTNTVRVPLLVEGNHRHVGRVETRLIGELLVQHVLVDTQLVVILRRPSDVEALPEEEPQRLLVRRSDGAVDLPSRDTPGVFFSALKEHASDSHCATVVGTDDQRTDLHRLLPLLHDVDKADRLALELGDEHMLSRREVADSIDTSLHVRVEDTPRVCAVVATVERGQRPVHQICDPFEVVSTRFADDDDVVDQ